MKLATAVFVNSLFMFTLACAETYSFKADVSTRGVPPPSYDASVSNVKRNETTGSIIVEKEEIIIAVQESAEGSERPQVEENPPPQDAPSPEQEAIVVPAPQVPPVNPTEPLEEVPAPLTLELVLPSNEIKAGKNSLQAQVIFSRPSDSDVIWTIEGPTGSDPGIIDEKGIYTSPATASLEYFVTVTVSLEKDATIKASKQLKILPDATLFVGCVRGNAVFPITADVYTLPVNTARLPNFSAIASSKVSTVCMDKYDVPTRDFTAGFPEIPNLFEWFALQTKTKIVIPVSGDYRFRLLSDDGANLYIDGAKLIDNDGLHSPRSRDAIISLTQGDHELVLDYYQGPRTQIALQLFWLPPGGTNFVIIPTESFKP